jgi:hypothetical protein
MGNGLGYRYRSFKFDWRRQPILKQVQWILPVCRSKPTRAASLEGIRGWSLSNTAAVS